MRRIFSVLIVLLFLLGSVGLPALTASANAVGGIERVSMSHPGPHPRPKKKPKKKNPPPSWSSFWERPTPPPGHTKPKPNKPNPPRPPLKPNPNPPKPVKPKPHKPVKAKPVKKPKASPQQERLARLDARQTPERCVTLPARVVFKPVYIEKELTSVQRVLYGAGLVTMSAVLLVALVLLIGYAYGRVTALRSEREFIKSVLPKDK